jgi:hypothetical protein
LLITTDCILTCSTALHKEQERERARARERQFGEDGKRGRDETRWTAARFQGFQGLQGHTDGRRIRGNERVRPGTGATPISCSSLDPLELLHSAGPANQHALRLYTAVVTRKRCTRVQLHVILVLLVNARAVPVTTLAFPAALWTFAGTAVLFCPRDRNRKEHSFPRAHEHISALTRTLGTTAPPHHLVRTRSSLSQPNRRIGPCMK